MVCPHCGTENRDEAKFCAKCGRQLTSEPEEARQETETLEEPIPTEGAETETSKEEWAAPKPLPEGALLSQRRYEIVSLVGTRDRVNEYEAVETEPRKRCSVCETLNAPDSNFCEQCGNDLSSANLETLKVHLLEAGSPEFLQPFWALVEKSLHHRAIAAPLASFPDSPYDKRVYIALPIVKGEPLGRVEPKDVATAIAWSHLLADAFAHLADDMFGLKGSLETAVIFTEKGEPFILPEAISLEPCNWETIKQELAERIERWLNSVQAKEWVEQAIFAVNQAPDWHKAAAALKRLLELVQAPPLMRVEFSAATDVGRRREHNEDSYLTVQFERCHLDKVETLSILAVADGMGGHAAGEVASRLCLQVFVSNLLSSVNEWLNFGEPNWSEAMKTAFVEANRQVFAEAQAMRNNMGTTLTAVVLCGNKAVFANVGDSRGYLLQSGKLKQITKDHSLVQQLVDTGILTPEQARWHPKRNIITQAIGIDPSVQVDIFEVTLLPGDLVLLCSDGLVDMVEDSEIERVLMSEPTVNTAAQTLVRLANEAGGEDNITVIVAKVV
ncbi:MAG: Stp1/IreP family PP2C-type Ser/Thr phosphatase [Candidatus Fervidibacter sp.]|uniref:Stp1/IreP family PP2C-type Ser/Thr phosphatase n=1 Tax=Candidatus Fervidibacter sp. TaxID=3100871 RepID=UPI0040493DF4